MAQEQYVASGAIRRLVAPARHMPPIGLPKVQNTTLHRKQSRFLRNTRIFCLSRSAGLQPAASLARAAYPILPETVYVSGEGMVFLFYGLNGAEMSQSV